MRYRTSIRKWQGGGVGIRPPDDELVALDLCVINSARLEMLTDQSNGDALDLDRIPEGPESLCQRDDKVPVARHTWTGILVLFFRRTIGRRAPPHDPLALHT